MEKATRMPNCGRCKSFKFKVGASTAHCTVKIVEVNLNRTCGPHYRVVALIIGLSLVGVVIFGTTAGPMVPFLLRRCGL